MPRGRIQRSRTAPPSLAHVAAGIEPSADGDMAADEETEASITEKPPSLDGDLIRRRWRSLVGRHPPKTISHALMDRILAWREQIVEGGDVSPRSRAILAAALAGGGKGALKDGEGETGETKVDPESRRPHLHAPGRLGTALFREHGGVLHCVTVVADGFEWEGRKYASLSAVARAITGIRWNGRRFFALDRGEKQAAVRRERGRDAEPRRLSCEQNGSSQAGGAQ